MGIFSYISHAVICCCCCFNLGSFCYTSRSGCIFMQGVSRTHPVLALFLSGEFFLDIPCLLFFLCVGVGGGGGGEFLLQIRCWLYFSVGTFSYISHDDFVFNWGVSLTHPVLPSVLCGEFLLHIPCWVHCIARSFSYTSRAGFFYSSGQFLTHPVLALILCGEFLLHIPSWRHFYLGSLSCTFRAGFILL